MKKFQDLNSNIKENSLILEPKENNLQVLSEKESFNFFDKEEGIKLLPSGIWLNFEEVMNEEESEIGLVQNKNNSQIFNNFGIYLNNTEKEKINFEQENFYIENVTFKKNRNNFKEKISDLERNEIQEKSYIIHKSKNDNNNLFLNNLNNILLSSESTQNKTKNITFIRCDTLLIKFKAAVGKSFINFINQSLKNIMKRRIKFYSFNYRKFTLNVSYNANKIWLNTKIEELLIYGEETNQLKNKKALESLYKKKDKKFDKIKKILGFTYETIIESFYDSNYFIMFKKKEKIMELDNIFKKIMGISLLEKNGFINFLKFRKGNTKKK